MYVLNDASSGRLAINQSENLIIDIHGRDRLFEDCLVIGANCNAGVIGEACRWHPGERGTGDHAYPCTPCKANCNSQRARKCCRSSSAFTARDDTGREASQTSQDRGTVGEE